MKKSAMYTVLYAVFLIIFNLLFFLLKEEYTAAVWISYGFIHFAYITLVITQFCEEKHKEVALKLSSYLVSVIYFVFEFLTGIIVILITPEGHKLSLAIQVILLGIYLVILISNLIINSKIRDSLEESEENLNYVKGVSGVVKSLMTCVNDESVTKKLELFYNTVHESPLKTNGEGIAIEQQIQERVLRLESNIKTSNDLDTLSEIEDLINLAQKRNIILQKHTG